MKNGIFLSFVIVITLLSCNENKINEHINSNKFDLDPKDSTKTLEFSMDSTDKSFELIYNESNPYYEQTYRFDKNGNLTENRGQNFFGEVEAYFFDYNNTLYEFRKIVHYNEKKEGLQEYIIYRYGIIDINRSHYFEFFISDSSSSQYEVTLNYKGSRKVKEIEIFVNDFNMYMDSCNWKTPIFKFNSANNTFWVDKQKIYDSEIQFFQINVSCSLYKNDWDYKNMVYYDSRLKKRNWKSQSFMLRKLKQNMIFTIDK